MDRIKKRNAIDKEVKNVDKYHSSQLDWDRQIDITGLRFGAWDVEGRADKVGEFWVRCSICGVRRIYNYHHVTMTPFCRACSCDMRSGRELKNRDGFQLLGTSTVPHPLPDGFQKVIWSPPTLKYTEVQPGLKHGWRFAVYTDSQQKKDKKSPHMERIATALEEKKSQRGFFKVVRSKLANAFFNIAAKIE